jgi:hypothetical protein
MSTEAVDTKSRILLATALTGTRAFPPRNSSGQFICNIFNHVQIIQFLQTSWCIESLRGRLRVGDHDAGFARSVSCWEGGLLRSDSSGTRDIFFSSHDIRAHHLLFLTTAVLALLHILVLEPRPRQGDLSLPLSSPLPFPASISFRVQFSFSFNIFFQHLKTCRQALEDRACIAKEQRREAIKARAASSSPSPAVANGSSKSSPFPPSPAAPLSEAELLRLREQGERPLFCIAHRPRVNE